ncbi:DUF4367 domain-containing protein [Thalassobacillus pellis]|uniref:DUF4367 domain-containing protein n=1 Tax=Thalassobacillus pellis TaxID=748008 RepID=UPI00196023B1
MTIKNGLKGTYGEQGDNRILKWKNNGIYYELFFKFNSISQTEMIRIAASAEQPE